MDKSMRRYPRRLSTVGVILMAVGQARTLRAQTAGACVADRTVATAVGAGLGAAAAAIPATMVHRHDQTSSHRIVAVSVSTGALIGWLAASRDQPCLPRGDSGRSADPVLAGRSSHAGRGAAAGAFLGGVLGVIGSRYYNVGCDGRPCNTTGLRARLTLFSAGEGAVAGGLLGGLIGWAWPTGRR